MDDKRFFLARFIDAHPGSRIIVFVRTRVRAERVEKALAREGIQALNIHGGRDQDLRTRAMDQFKRGEVDILIATDVSARGIDVPDVAYVINYDLPEKAENYVHRVGRTGRGVRKGTAISFCSPGEKTLLSDIEAFIGKSVEVLPVSRRTYEAVLESPLEEMSVEEMIQENEARLQGKKRKKRKKGG